MILVRVMPIKKKALLVEQKTVKVQSGLPREALAAVLTDAGYPPAA